METTYFALGVLSMIAVMFVAVIVIGLIKVMRLEKNLTRVEERIEDSYRYTEEVRKEIEVKIAECFRYTDKRFDKKS